MRHLKTTQKLQALATAGMHRQVIILRDSICQGQNRQFKIIPVTIGAMRKSNTRLLEKSFMWFLTVPVESQSRYKRNRLTVFPKSTPREYFGCLHESV